MSYLLKGGTGIYYKFPMGFRNNARKLRAQRKKTVIAN